MSFESTLVAWFIPATAIFLSIAFALDFARRRWTLESIGDRGMISVMTASLYRGRRVMRAVLFTLGATLSVAALAQPSERGVGVVSQRGIDVAVVLDFSKSMLAMDVYPNRIERAKTEAEGLIKGLAADRVATVVFAGGAEPFPLTSDHEAAQLLYQGLRPGDLAPGSNLGQAFKVARCVLRPDVGGDEECAELGGAARAEREEAEAIPQAMEDRARAIVVFTDGEDTDGEASMELARAIELGIEVYVVGVGTTMGARIPKLDAEGIPVGWERNSRGGLLDSRLNKASLQELAARAGGNSRYFSLGEGRWRSDMLLTNLKSLKKGDQDAQVVQTTVHVFQSFLFPAFLLLIIEACLSERRRRAALPGRHLA
jgi:Ca-activated chloride channel family protein